MQELLQAALCSPPPNNKVSQVWQVWQDRGLVTSVEGSSRGFIFVIVTPHIVQPVSPWLVGVSIPSLSICLDSQPVHVCRLTSDSCVHGWRSPLMGEKFRITGNVRAQSGAIWSVTQVTLSQGQASDSHLF